MALELVKLDNTTFPRIADAIRAKTGETELLLPSQMAAAIANISAGGGGNELFNNESAVEMGSFTPSTDNFGYGQGAEYFIQLSNSNEPYMIYVWAIDPDISVTQKIGAFFYKTSGSNSLSNISIFITSGNITSGSGANNGGFRIYPKNNGFAICVHSTYPMKASVEFAWMVRWKS